MSRVIEFDLSKAGIDRAIEELREFQNGFLRKCGEIILYLADMGRTQARFNIITAGRVDTGLLANSIQALYNPSTRTGIVYTDLYYAIFVEYGTGIVGNYMDHPEAGKVGWVYDHNAHGVSGWNYYNFREGQWQNTAGQSATAFMWNAKMALRNIAPGYYRQIFEGWDGR